MHNERTSGGDGAARVEALATAIEAALREHRTTVETVQELAGIHDATPDEVRAARLLASAALMLAFASKGACSRVDEARMQRELRAISIITESAERG